MRVDEFRATEWNIPLTENPYFVVLATYFTIFFELAFAFLVWFKRTKFFILLMGVLLDIGIWVFMRIDNFSWIMIGTYFLFITDTEYLKFQNWLTHERLTIFYDNWCPKCIKFTTLIKRLDFFNNISIKELRNMNIEKYSNINLQKAESHMASINPKGEVFYGYDTILKISSILPLLWLFLPLFCLFKLTGLGTIIYREIAINRKLILNCDSECQTK